MDDTIDALFRAEYAKLVRALTFACGSEDLAAEAVQDAFVQEDKHWSRICRYDDPARWLRRVAVNRITDARRRARRSDRKVDRLRAAGGPTGTGIEPALDDLAGTARSSGRQLALVYLPSRDRLAQEPTPEAAWMERYARRSKISTLPPAARSARHRSRSSTVCNGSLRAARCC